MCGLAAFGAQQKLVIEIGYFRFCPRCCLSERPLAGSERLGDSKRKHSRGSRMDIIEAALLGAVGGLLPDLIKAIRKRFQKMPTYLRRAWYWLNLAFLGIVGAIVSAIAHPSTIQEALAYGAGALALVTQALGQNDEQHLGDTEWVDPVRQIRAWWGS